LSYALDVTRKRTRDTKKGDTGNGKRHGDDLKTEAKLNPQRWGRRGIQLGTTSF